MSHQTQKSYYDSNAKSLKPLDVGQHIRIQNQKDKTWKPAIVTENHGHRSYSVKTPDGAVYRRNRRQLMQVKGQNTESLISPEFSQSPPEFNTLTELQTQTSNSHNSEHNQNNHDNLSSPESTSTCVPEKSDRIVTRSGRNVNRPQRLIETI